MVTWSSEWNQTIFPEWNNNNNNNNNKYQKKCEDQIGPIICAAPQATNNNNRFIVAFGKTFTMWERDELGTCASSTTEYEGHTDAITCVASSLNGEYLVTGSKDKSAIVWNLTNGTLVRYLCGHTAPVESVAVNESQTWYATAGRDKVVLVWDKDGCLVHSFRERSRITCVVLCADILVYAGDGGMIKICCLRYQNCRPFPISSPEGVSEETAVSSIAISPDGSLLFVVSTERSCVDMWDLADIEKPNHLRSTSFDHSPLLVRVNPCRYEIAVHTENEIITIDLENKVKSDPMKWRSMGKETAVGISTFAYSNSGEYIFAGYSNGVLVLWRSIV